MADEPLDPAPSVQAQVQPASAHLGDLVTLSIRVTHPNAYTVEAPLFQKTLGSFEVFASTRLPTQVQGPQQTDLYEAQLQNFSTGQQLLPGLELDYQDLVGKKHTLKTPELKVVISEVPGGPKDQGDIRGIKGVLGPIALSPWWWLLLFVVVAGAGLYAWTKRRRLIEGPPPPPPVPADEAALKKLGELLGTGWVEAGRLKEFYSALSDILRGYLEGGFDCPALERTTNEILRDLRKRNLFTPETLLEIKELLDDCDLVKFAKFKPENEEALKTHRGTVQIVEKTRNEMKKNGGG